jgi:Fe-S-cluster-containing dehydrogenase component
MDSANAKKVTRRGFLLSSAAAGAALFLVRASDVPPSTQSGPRPRHAVLVNATTCIGCMRCVAGCETYHREYYGLSAQGTAYTKVVTVNDGTYVPELCLHCFDSPCTKACITHALTQLDYGPVIYDKGKCIGCLLCVNQCQFGSITFNPVERKIYKCDMCHLLVEQGKNPSCVQVCPTGTRSFGLYEDKLKEGLKLADDNNGVLLYPRDSTTLYVISEKMFESLAGGAEVPVIKRTYPTDTRWVAELLKYSRVAWIPVTLGAAFYVAKWSKNRSDGAT